MPLKVVLALGLIFRAFAGSPTASAPSFDCKDAEGSAYRIWIGPSHNALQVVEKGTTREIPLSDANVGRPLSGPGQPLLYNGWNRKGVVIQTRLDLANEVSVQYQLKDGASVVKLGIVVDNRERMGLSCRASRYSVSVKPLADDSSAALRNAAAINEMERYRTPFGTLEPVSSMVIEAAVERFCRSAEFTHPEGRRAFLSAISASLKNIDPRTVTLIGGSLKPTASDYWKTLLTDSRYAFYPKVARFAAWVKEAGAASPQHDLISLRAGFAGFVSSGEFREKEMRDFFVSETAPSLRSLSEAEVGQIAEGLTPDARAYLGQLWAKAAGKLHLDDDEELGRLTNRLASAVEAKNFDPQQVANVINDFRHSTLIDRVDGRARFFQTASPIAKKLTPRQREDVNGWLKDKEKKILAELLK